MPLYEYSKRIGQREETTWQSRVRVSYRQKALKFYLEAQKLDQENNNEPGARATLAEAFEFYAARLREELNG